MVGKMVTKLGAIDDPGFYQKLVCTLDMTVSYLKKEESKSKEREHTLEERNAEFKLLSMDDLRWLMLMKKMKNVSLVVVEEFHLVFKFQSINQSR